MGYYSVGSTGPEVTKIQQALARVNGNVGTPVDGNFTRRTGSAVKVFQKEHQLTVDGEVGPDTWVKLFPGEDYVDPVRPQVSVDDTRIPLFKGQYITLGLIASLVGWAVLTTYTLTQHIEVDPLQKQLDDKQQQISAVAADNQHLLSAYSDLQQQTALPVLRSPRNESLLVGNEVEFDWEHRGDDPSAQYMLELRNPKTGQTWLLNVPGQKWLHNGLTVSSHKTFYTFAKGQLDTEYLWRVRRGTLQETIFTNEEGYLRRKAAADFGAQVSEGEWNPNGPGWIPSSPAIAFTDQPRASATSKTLAEVVGQVAEGEWSSYGDFWIFQNAEERIKATGKLTVGVSPTSYGLLSTVDHAGRITGFEEDLVNSVARELGREFGRTIDVKVVFKEFGELLPTLDRDEIDMVVASVTSTLQRERKYHIQFTNGYFPVRQVLVALRTNDKSYFRTNVPRIRSLIGGKLQGRSSTNGLPEEATVAVNADTTNQHAAEYLIHSRGRKYNFKIVNHFRTTEEIYQASKRGEVDTALVDDVSVIRHYLDEKAICRVTDLNSDLIPFYKTELPDPKDGEQYAIAVSDPELLEMVNGILVAHRKELEFAANHLVDEEGVPIGPIESVIPLCE